MKLINKLLLAIGLAFLVSTTSHAQTFGMNAYGTGGTSTGGGGGTNYAIIPGEWFFNGGSPGITYINLSSFGISNTLSVFAPTNKTVIVGTNASIGSSGALVLAGVGGTNYVLNTNGFGVGTFVVVQHLQSGYLPQNLGQYNLKTSDEFGIVSALAPGIVTTNAQGAIITNNIIVLASNLSYQQSNSVANGGDVIWQMSTNAIIPIVSSSTTPTALGTGVGPILVGTKGAPMLLYLQPTGVGTNTINAVSAQGF